MLLLLYSMLFIILRIIKAHPFFINFYILLLFVFVVVVVAAGDGCGCVVVVGNGTESFKRLSARLKVCASTPSEYGFDCASVRASE